ncbi:MAG: DUF6364 family protein [Chitinophagales bacterium]
MENTLVLKIDKRIIEKAEKYADNQGSSLSNLIEDYLKLVIEDKPIRDENPPKTSIVANLRGVLKVGSIENFDEKKILEEELLKKYGI